MPLKPWDIRIAHFMIRPFRRTPLTPNHVTTLSLMFGVACGVCFAVGNPAAITLAPMLYIFGTLLDHADGELARLTGRSSKAGHYYDHAAGGASYVALFVGLGLGLRHDVQGAHAIPLGLIAAFSTVTAMSLRLIMEKRHGKAALIQPNIAGFEIEDLMYLIGPATWLGLRRGFLVLAAVGASVYAIYALWILVRSLLQPPSVRPNQDAA